MTIRVEGLTKSFRTGSALNGIDLTIDDGAFVVLFGPSGSGKTTLLRIIAGLETADGGQVLFDGADVTDLPTRERNIGFVFQQYALFRHMTVAENIAFGLKVQRGKRPAKAAMEARVTEMLGLVRLPGYGGRYPAELSGGQRQRIAVARALAREPRILLLDEPFGALDPDVRHELRLALRAIHDDLGLTTVLVTHDREEALALADRIAVLSEGRVTGFETPDASQVGADAAAASASAAARDSR